MKLAVEHCRDNFNGIKPCFFLIVQYWTFCHFDILPGRTLCNGYLWLTRNWQIVFRLWTSWCFVLVLQVQFSQMKWNKQLRNTSHNLDIFFKNKKHNINKHEFQCLWEKIYAQCHKYHEGCAFPFVMIQVKSYLQVKC